MTRWTLALTVVAVAGVASCAAPSVPIPPPSPEAMRFSVDTLGGTARFAFQPVASYAGAIVYVFNRDAGEGIITMADADGAVAETRPFPAQEGDEVVISFELDSQISSTCVHLQDGQSSSGLECDL